MRAPAVRAPPTAAVSATSGKDELASEQRIGAIRPVRCPDGTCCFSEVEAFRISMCGEASDSDLAESTEPTRIDERVVGAPHRALTAVVPGKPRADLC